MATCAEIRAQITPYIDDELPGPDRVAFEAHTTSCTLCHTALAAEWAFIQKLRAAWPLYRVSAELQERMERIIAEGGEVPSSHGARTQWRAHREEISASATPQGWLLSSAQSHWLAAAIVALIATLLGTVYYITQPQPPAPSEFAMAVTDAHLRYLRGQLPLEIVTDSPQQVSDWLTDKLSFKFRLPNYEVPPGQQKYYKLEGARLVDFKQDKAAYVAYRMNRKLVSLLVTSDTITHPFGGEEIASRGITFHFQSHNGLKLITWSDRGLTYALASDFEERGQQSCMICHQGVESHRLIEPLNHKNVR